MFSDRPRRTVNLGNRRVVSKEDALKNAEEKRRTRLESRKRIESAAVLQRYWRGCMLRADARQAMAKQGNLQSTIEFGYILPQIPMLPQDEQIELLKNFAISPLSNSFEPLILERLIALWDPSNEPIHNLACHILQRQLTAENLTRAPVHMDTITEYLRASSLSTAVTQLLLSLNPEQGLLSVLEILSDELNNVEFTPESLRPLYNVRSINAETSVNSEAALFLIEMLIPQIDTSYPLIHALIRAIPASINLSHILNHLTSVNLFRRMSYDQLAYYIADLKLHCPTKASYIMEHVALAVHPFTLWIHYKKRKTEAMMTLAFETISYHLLVTTDKELSLYIDKVQEVTAEVKERSLRLLWEYRPTEDCVVSSNHILTIRLLRQLYNRDTRMQIFGHEYWVKPIPLYTMKGLDVHSYQREFNMGDHKRLVHTDTELEFSAKPVMRVLQYAPFFITFDSRADLFYKLVERERLAFEYGSWDTFTINREAMVEDAEKAFLRHGPNVANSKFEIWSDGLAEEGVDGGGLTKEVLMTICESAFEEEIEGHPAFIMTENHQLLPNPIFGEMPKLFSPEVRNRFYFLGLVVGKCLFHNILIKDQFSPFFLSKWTHNQSSFLEKSAFDDLSLLDPELYRSLSGLYGVRGHDLAAMNLDFSIRNSANKVVDLIPNGRNIPINDSNKLAYIWKVAHYHLNICFKPQCLWFLRGLDDIVSLHWLNMFNVNELNRLVSGDLQVLDVDDLMENTEVYSFSPDSRTMANFWRLLNEFTAEQRAKFLKFVTSVPRGPLLGFKKLNPKFGIRCAGNDDERLPTASTCFNLLKLPEYSSYEVLKEKLLYAIESGSTFDLS